MSHHRTTSTSQQTEVIFFDDFTAPELDCSAWNVEVMGQVNNNAQQDCIEYGLHDQTNGVTFNIAQKSPEHIKKG